MGHRAVGLEDREHPGGQRDLVAVQAGRVATAVDALVVVEHRVGDVVQRGRLAEHVEAQPRVQGDQRALVGRELARAQAHPVGQREISDRAQQRRADQPVARPRVELELLPEQPGVDGELAGLAMQDRVVRGHRLAEDADGRPVGVTELVLVSEQEIVDAACEVFSAS